MVVTAGNHGSFRPEKIRRAACRQGYVRILRYQGPGHPSPEDRCGGRSVSGLV